MGTRDLWNKPSASKEPASVTSVVLLFLRMSSVSVSKRKRPTPSTPSIDKVYFDETWQSLLEVEWTISQAFLRQHRMAHGKTRYFRRFEMAIRALSKARVTTLYAVWQKVQTHETNKIAKQNWSVQQDQQQHQRKMILKKFCSDINVLLRLEACVEPLLNELSRGFFVPLNTALLANVARLWVLVQGLQKQVQFAMEFPIQTGYAASEGPAKTSIQNNKTINRAAEILSSLGIDLDWETLDGPTTAKKKEKPSKTSGDVYEEEIQQSAEQMSESSIFAPTKREEQDTRASEPEHPNVASSTKRSPLHHDTQDVGESVPEFLFSSSSLTVKNPTRSQTPPSKDNHDLVKDWQQKQQKQQKQEKDSRKRKSDGKKDKKKKKKSKKKDFFDDLFG